LENELNLCRSVQYPDILGLMSALINRPLPAQAEPFSEAQQFTKPSPTMLDLLACRQITSFVIDAEVVALDKDSGGFRTFQDLSNRAKKDVKVEDIKVIVGVFSFDLMLLNDEVSDMYHEPIGQDSDAISRGCLAAT
jgi:DNA ligase-1